MPAAAQRFIISSFRHRFMLRVVQRRTEIIDSTAFVQERLRARRSETCKRLIVNMS
jgi:hypothetical protein